MLVVLWCSGAVFVGWRYVCGVLRVCLAFAVLGLLCLVDLKVGIHTYVYGFKDVMRFLWPVFAVSCDGSTLPVHFYAWEFPSMVVVRNKGPPVVVV